MHSSLALVAVMSVSISAIYIPHGEHCTLDALEHVTDYTNSICEAMPKCPAGFRRWVDMTGVHEGVIGEVNKTKSAEGKYDNFFADQLKGDQSILSQLLGEDGYASSEVSEQLYDYYTRTAENMDECEGTLIECCCPIYSAKMCAVKKLQKYCTCQEIP